MRNLRQRGQALVELALILPVVAMLVVAATDLGRAYYAYVGIVGAAEQGARVAADLRNDDTAINTAVKNEPDGNLTIADGDILVSCPGGLSPVYGIPASCRQRGMPVQVAVRYNFRLVTPFVARLLGNDTIVLQGSAARVVE